MSGGHSSGVFVLFYTDEEKYQKERMASMERLNYDVLKKSGYDGYILEKAPEKVLQFGEGNFLRAFVDYWFGLFP